jgi:NAD(P)-dependent dehydrogenase (short-subunit alcohol dehydrogenase family)
MAEKDIVFITGANTGIGFEVVKALLQSPKGYHILLGSRSLEKGKEAISQLAEVLEGSSNTVELVEIDVTVDETINKAAELVEAKFGRLDALVNNAGEPCLHLTTPLLTPSGLTYDERRRF